MGFSHGSLTLNEKHLGKQREDGVRSKRRTYPKARQRRNGYPGAGLFCDVEARKSAVGVVFQPPFQPLHPFGDVDDQLGEEADEDHQQAGEPKKIASLRWNVSRNFKVTTSRKETGSREKPNLERPAWRGS